LIVYDGWGNLRLRDALAIVLGPVLAMFISHLFASTLGSLELSLAFWAGIAARSAGTMGDRSHWPSWPAWWSAPSSSGYR
jgi:hypothetical protein